MQYGYSLWLLPNSHVKFSTNHTTINFLYAALNPQQLDPRPLGRPHQLLSYPLPKLGQQLLASKAEPIPGPANQFPESFPSPRVIKRQPPNDQQSPFPLTSAERVTSSHLLGVTQYLPLTSHLLIQKSLNRYYAENTFQYLMDQKSDSLIVSQSAIQPF